jgi:lysophospholipase L1-like esterase
MSSISPFNTDLTATPSTGTTHHWKAIGLAAAVVVVVIVVIVLVLVLLPSSSSSSTSLSGTAGAYSPTGWNSAFKTALSQSGTRLVQIGWCGDSISAGSFASNQMPNTHGKGFVQQLQNTLQTQYGDGGSGFVSPSASYATVHNNIYPNGTLPVTWNPSSSTWGVSHFGGGPNGTWYGGPDSVSDSMTFYVRGTKIVIYYMVGNETGLGTAQAVVDAGTPHVFSLVGSTKYKFTEYVINNQTAGDHMVTISIASGTDFYICGVGAFNATGVVINNFSSPGIALQTVASSQGTSDDDPFSCSGGGVVSTLVSDLNVLALGANDTAEDGPSYLAYVQHAAQVWMTTARQSSTLFLNTVAAGNWTLTQYQNNISHRAGTRAVAQSFGAAHIDLNPLLAHNSYNYLLGLGFWANGDVGGYPSVPGVSGTTTPNQLHPSDTGHTMMANAVYPLLIV